MPRKRGSAKPTGPVTFAEVCALAATLPGVEKSTSYGTPALKVKGKLFARLKEDGETLMLRSDFLDRDLLMRAAPQTFFITDHYRNYPAVLVRLTIVERPRLAELLEDAWRRVAPKRLVRELDDELTARAAARERRSPRGGAPGRRAAAPDS